MPPAAAASISGYCRDCLSPAAGGRCSTCGSPRVVHHPELFRLSVAHLDCDAFYAAIEKRDDPSLADQPVIVGGGKRGVVSTACYIARIKGVRSAMPMFQALKALPGGGGHPAQHGEIRPRRPRGARPDARADAAGRAALDRRGLSRPFRHRAAARRAAGADPRQARAEGRAGDRHHRVDRPLLQQVPRQDRLRPREAAWLFGHRRRPKRSPSSASSRSGRSGASARPCRRGSPRDGIRTIGALQRMDEGELVRRYGSIGLRLAHLSHARDPRKVDPRGEAKSVSAETTFETDITDGRRLKPILRTLSDACRGGSRRPTSPAAS